MLDLRLLAAAAQAPARARPAGRRHRRSTLPPVHAGRRLRQRRHSTCSRRWTSCSTACTWARVRDHPGRRAAVCLQPARPGRRLDRTGHRAAPAAAARHPMATPSSTASWPSAATTAATARPVSPGSSATPTTPATCRPTATAPGRISTLTLTRADAMQACRSSWPRAATTRGRPRSKRRASIPNRCSATARSARWPVAAGQRRPPRRHASTASSTSTTTQLLLQPLRARFSDDLNTLAAASSSTLGSPQIKGKLRRQRHGAARRRAGQRRTRHPLERPAAAGGPGRPGAGQPRRAHRQRQRGAATTPKAMSHVGPPGKLAELALDLDGTPQQITLHTLALKQPRAACRPRAC